MSGKKEKSKGVKVSSPDQVAPKGSLVVVPPKDSSQLDATPLSHFLEKWHDLVPPSVKILHPQFFPPTDSKSEVPFEYEELSERIDKSLEGMGRNFGEQLKQYGPNKHVKMLVIDPEPDVDDSAGPPPPKKVVGLVCCKPNCEKKATKDKLFMKCGKCGTVAYCSKECQVEHWKAHKNECQAPKPVIMMTDLKKKLKSATDMIGLLLGDLWMIGGAWKKQYGEGLLVMECGDLMNWHKLNSEEFCQFFIYFMPKSLVKNLDDAAEGTVLHRHSQHFKLLVEQLDKLSTPNELLLVVVDQLSMYCWKILLPSDQILATLEPEFQTLQKSQLIMMDTFKGLKLLMLEKRRKS